VTAPARDPRPADDRVPDGHPRIHWFSGPSLRLHAALASGVALSSGATWLEWTRAREGHAIAWVYTFEWPLFAVLGIYLWWRLLHPEEKRVPGSAGAAETGDVEPDPELLAWQAYLAGLHAVDPPGGPPHRGPMAERVSAATGAGRRRRRSRTAPRGSGSRP
jgi:hypothetical protein